MYILSMVSWKSVLDLRRDVPSVGVGRFIDLSLSFLKDIKKVLVRLKGPHFISSDGDT